MCAPKLGLLALQPPFLAPACCSYLAQHLHSRYCCHLAHSAQHRLAEPGPRSASSPPHPTPHHSCQQPSAPPKPSTPPPTAQPHDTHHHHPSPPPPCMQPPEAVKPSQGLEYTYARKPAALDHERRDLAHIWELGGGEQLAAALMSADNVFLSFRQVRRGAGCGPAGLHWLWHQQAWDVRCQQQQHSHRSAHAP
jgi:hypothetical protein